MRGDKEVNTVKKRWPDAPFKDGARVRPEDAFAALLGTADGKKYLDAAEQGTFDSQSAKNIIKKFTTFGLQNKLLVSLKDAAENFYPKAGEIISAVRSMPTGEYADYVKQNFSGISYGKVGFMSGHLGRGDLPTFDSRQKQLVYGKDVEITKERLLEQRDRLLKLGIHVPEKYKEFAQTLLHHEVWDRLNKSDTEHGEIKNAMLNFMPADSDYLAAAKSRDTKATQQMVDQAAKAAGYDSELLYRGRSEKSPIPFFGKDGAHFTSIKEYARSYGEGDEANVISGHAKITNALRVDLAISESKSFEQFRKHLAKQGVPMDTPARLFEYSQNKEYENTRTINEALTQLQKDMSWTDFKEDPSNSFTDNLGHAVWPLGFDAIRTFEHGKTDIPVVILKQANQIKSADPITRDDAGNIIPLSQRFKGSNDIRFMPETRVSGQQGSDTTQIATTVKTYGKAAGLFPKNTRILDVGAGLGLGADEMRKNGHSVDTVEPLSARWSSPTPRTFETIDQATEKYPGIVNFSVLNVVEPKLRDQIVDGIGQRLADGGTAYITARTRSDVEGAKNKRPANEAGGYWIKKSGGNVYQKGFSTPELVGYVQTRLGDQFKVKPASGLSGAAIEIKKFMPAMQFSAPENLPNGKVWRGENGYAIIQKEGGKFRVHSPIGLIGIAASYEAAEKMANKRNTR
jgi:hypothetical protein